MNTLEEIKKREEIITETHNHIQHLETKGGWRKLFHLRRVKRKIRHLEDVQFYSVDDYLKATDQNYQELVAHNYELLQTPNIHFTVYTNVSSLLGNHSTEVAGTISPNGYSYSYSSRSNVAMLPFDSMSYPGKMTGYVDHWGNLKLKTTEKKYSLMKSLPKKFHGHVGPNGVIEIQNIENTWEFTKGTTMGKLIANHFEYDEQKNFHFQQNRNALTELVHQFRDKIKNS